MDLKSAPQRGPSAPMIGRALSRVEGKLKVTGKARYAADYTAPDLLHGVVVSAAIPAGRIVAIDTLHAQAIAGVVAIYTHENRGKAAWLDRKWRDQVAPPGHPFRPLHSDRILFDGQPIALVVAETYEAARDAASLVRATYEKETHCTDLDVLRDRAYEPAKKRKGVSGPAKARGDFDAAFGAADVHMQMEYQIAPEHHNPMELFAATCVWEGDEKITVYDKTQGCQNVQAYIADVFGLKADDVTVINHHVGGAFGVALRPQASLFFAVMASLELKRSVRVGLTRAQMFHTGYRPGALQTIGVAGNKDGFLKAVMHDAVSSTSMFEDYQENIVNWSGLLYHCENTKFGYRLVQLNTTTPCDMRAPGAASGVNAFECAVDELTEALGLDPLAFRQDNFAYTDENTDKEITSKALQACYRAGAAAIGWDKRAPAPSSRESGHERTGLGMATGVWEAYMQKASAKARIDHDGTLTVSTATADIGTGTWTILAQVAADSFGLPLDQVRVQIGDSTLPKSPVQGGSWTAATAGAAVDKACLTLKEAIFKAAQKMGNTPFRGCAFEECDVAAGRIFVKAEPARGASVAEVMDAAETVCFEEEATVMPNVLQMMKHVSYTHSAVFAEVAVDRDLGVVRVLKVVCAVAAGRILNTKTARSQVMGGVVMGIGMALHEEAKVDHRFGRIMNANIAEYHVPVNADIADIEVIFVEEHDEKVSPLGVKGLGEIGIVGAAAAVANAVYNACGVRVRTFPITIDKLLDQ